MLDIRLVAPSAQQKIRSDLVHVESLRRFHRTQPYTLMIEDLPLRLVISRCPCFRDPEIPIRVDMETPVRCHLVRERHVGEGLFIDLSSPCVACSRQAIANVCLDVVGGDFQVRLG